jgi:hypothetical protein
VDLVDEHHGWAVVRLADASQRVGDIANLVERRGRDLYKPNFLPELLDARARVHAAKGEHEARRETLRRGLQIAKENGAHGCEKRFEHTLAGAMDPVGPERR